LGVEAWGPFAWRLLVARGLILSRPVVFLVLVVARSVIGFRVMAVPRLPLVFVVMIVFMFMPVSV
jgi:hypothetical protein